VKRSVAYLSLVAVATGVGAASAGATVATQGAASAAGARVARVIDGDTIEVASGARIRLVQIDTPELGSGECYSRKGRE